MYSIFVEEELRRTISDFDGELFRFRLLRAGHVAGSVDVLGRNLKTKQIRTNHDAVAAITKAQIAKRNGRTDGLTQLVSFLLFSPRFMSSQFKRDTVSRVDPFSRLIAAQLPLVAFSP